MLKEIPISVAGGAENGMNFVNQREIMINAMQRSGHHAFVDWLVKNCPKHLFLNCVRDDKFLRRGFIRSKPELRFLNDLNLSLDRELAGDFVQKDLLVYNMENQFTRAALETFQSEQKAANIGSSKYEFFVVWLRDPFNNLASICNRGKRKLLRPADAPEYKQRVENLNFSCELWVDHFETFKAALDGKNKFVPVLYNTWVADGQVREVLAALFNISSHRRADQTVSWGGGSSFEPFYDGQPAPELSELESRWITMKDLAPFRALFRKERFRDAVLQFREIYRSSVLDRAHGELVG